MRPSIGLLTANVEIRSALTVHGSHEVECPGKESGRERAVSTVRADPRGREIIMEMNFDRYGGVDLSRLFRDMTRPRQR